METANANIAPASATQTVTKLIRYRTLLALFDTLYVRQEIDAEVRETAGAVTAVHSGIDPASIFL